MRAALEALLIIGGALGLFWFAYSAWLRTRRAERAARQEERERENDYLDKFRQ